MGKIGLLQPNDSASEWGVVDSDLIVGVIERSELDVLIESTCDFGSIQRRHGIRCPVYDRVHPGPIGGHDRPICMIEHGLRYE